MQKAALFEKFEVMDERGNAPRGLGDSYEFTCFKELDRELREFPVGFAKKPLSKLSL